MYSYFKAYMTTQEYFYTAEFFQSAKIDPFIEHIRQYLEGQRTIPVSKTTSSNARNITFTFSDSLLNLFLKQPDSINKPYETALKYGFRGHSSGGKNGIFYLRNRDSRLIEVVNRSVIRYEDPIRDDLDLKGNSLDALRKVKIVCHNPLGERVFGVYNTLNDRMIFLDLAQY